MECIYFVNGLHPPTELVYCALKTRHSQKLRRLLGMPRHIIDLGLNIKIICAARENSWLPSLVQMFISRDPTVSVEQDLR